MTFQITVNTALITGPAEPGGATPDIATPATITTLSASGDVVSYTLPSDPATAEGVSISNRVVALVPLDEYTGFEQAPEEWFNARWTARLSAGASSTFTAVQPGDYRLVWEARDQPSVNIIARSGWSTGAAVTVGTVGQATVPAQMSAPSLAVDTLAITATLAADPDDGGSAIIGYDLRYSTDEINWTFLQSITSPREVTNLPGETLHYFQSRAKNNIGSGAWSTSATATTGAGTPVDPPAPGTVSDTLSLENIELLLTDPTMRGVRSGVTFKNPVDNAGDLPAGVTVSGSTITFGSSLSGAIFDGWNFYGYDVQVDGNIARFRDCVFGVLTRNVSALGAWRLGTSAQVDLIEWCSFMGPGWAGNSGAIPCIWEANSGSGASLVTGTIDEIYRCEFFGWGADIIKAPAGGLFHFNYFDAAVALPTDTRPWDSGRTYQDGEFVVDDGKNFAWTSQKNNNNDPIPSSKVSTASWGLFDPHHDLVNPRRQTGAVRGLIYRANYLNRDLELGYLTHPLEADGFAPAHAGGSTNCIRNVKNNTTQGDLHNGIIAEYNILTRKCRRNFSDPIDAGNLSYPNTQYSIFRNNWISPADNGDMIAGSSGHVIQNNVVYNTPTGRAAGYDGPAFA